MLQKAERRIVKISESVQPLLEPRERVHDAVYGAAGGRTAIFLGLFALFDSRIRA